MRMISNDEIKHLNSDEKEVALRNAHRFIDIQKDQFRIKKMNTLMEAISVMDDVSESAPREVRIYFNEAVRRLRDIINALGEQIILDSNNGGGKE